MILDYRKNILATKFFKKNYFCRIESRIVDLSEINLLTYSFYDIYKIKIYIYYIIIIITTIINPTN